MPKLQIINILLFITALFGVSSMPGFAQGLPSRGPVPPLTQDEQSGTFGEFEVGLPGLPENQTIDDFVDKPEPILRFINLAINAVIAVLVIIGLISIVIGGYVYMTSAGDASRVKLAKEMIIAALAGIFLSLTSVIILNTVNRFLGSDAQEPEIKVEEEGESPLNNFNP